MQESYPMERVRRLSRRLSRFCGGAVPVVLAVPPLWWGLVDTPLVYTDLPNGIPYPEVLSPQLRAAAAAVTLVPAGVMAWLLILLRRLFDGFARGEVFCRESHENLRRVARVLAIWFAVGCFHRTAVVLAVTIGNPPGQRILTLGLSAGDCATLFLSFVTVVLVWVFAEAERLRDESTGFI
jgi:hypothetical protein